jgi:hypothetical protein
MAETASLTRGGGWRGLGPPTLRTTTPMTGGDQQRPWPPELDATAPSRWPSLAPLLPMPGRRRRCPRSLPAPRRLNGNWEVSRTSRRMEAHGDGEPERKMEALGWLH